MSTTKSLEELMARKIEEESEEEEEEAKPSLWRALKEKITFILKSAWLHLIAIGTTVIWVVLLFILGIHELTWGEIILAIVIFASIVIFIVFFFVVGVVMSITQLIMFNPMLSIEIYMMKVVSPAFGIMLLLTLVYYIFYGSIPLFFILVWIVYGAIWILETLAYLYLWLI